MDDLAICSRSALLAARGPLESVSLPCSDLTEHHLEDFLYCGPADGLTGLVGLEISGPDALLRSLVVAPAARTAGIGSALLSRAEVYARARDVSEIYLLTTTAQASFEARGYRLSSRRELSSRDPRDPRVCESLPSKFRAVDEAPFNSLRPLQ